MHVIAPALAYAPAPALTSITPHMLWVSLCSCSLPELSLYKFPPDRLPSPQPVVVILNKLLGFFISDTFESGLYQAALIVVIV